MNESKGYVGNATIEAVQGMIGELMVDAQARLNEAFQNVGKIKPRFNIEITGKPGEEEANTIGVTMHFGEHATSLQRFVATTSSMVNAG